MKSGSQVMPVAVKICGIMTPEHAVAAVEAGADLIGLVFAPSRRRVSEAQARELAVAARAAAAATGATVAVVGVFVNEQPEAINALVESVGLDVVQFSGHEMPSQANTVMAPVVKAVRFDGDPSETGWLADGPGAGHAQAALLVDAQVQGSYGGAGVVADWRAATELARRRRVWLAGGLTPENVADAIALVQPYAVDVSSGVETSGTKDVAKITAFIRAAKQGSAVHDHAAKNRASRGC